VDGHVGVCWLGVGSGLGYFYPHENWEQNVLKCFHQLTHSFTSIVEAGAILAKSPTIRAVDADMKTR
jgi:hypothetical protein